MPRKRRGPPPDFAEYVAMRTLRWYLEYEVEWKRIIESESARKLKQIKSIVKNDGLSERERIELIEAVFLGLSLP